MVSYPCTVRGGTGFHPRSGSIRGSFSSVLQRTAKLVPGAVDVGLDRPQGEVEGGRDLLVRPAFDVPQHDARAVFGTKARDGPLDGRAELLRLHLVERILGAVGDVEAGGFDRLRRHRMGRAI